MPDPFLSSLFDSLSRTLSQSLDPSTSSLPPISSDVAKIIVHSASQAFSNEPTLLHLTGHFFVVGDLHGHVFELLRILTKFGLPPNAKYLLLGDIVDRGEFSVHTILYALLLKVLFPASFYLIRGNHESEDINSTHGLLTEVVDIYQNKDIFHALNEAFTWIPLAAVINGDLICVHGGIPPNLQTLDQISKIKRPLRVTDEPIAEGLLWSKFNAGGARSGREFVFNEDLVATFLAQNQLRLIVRGHEEIECGIQYSASQKVVTVFSISNYCERGGGIAGVLEITESGNEMSHLLPVLKWVTRKPLIPVVPPAARVLSAIPPKNTQGGQPPIVMRQFMRSRGKNRNAAIGVIGVA